MARTTLWILGFAALSAGLIEPSRLEHLPFTTSGYQKDVIDEFDQVFLRTAPIGWVGAVLAALFSDNRFFKRPAFISALAASLIVSALLFVTSSFFIPGNPASAHFPLSLYFAVHGSIEILLFSSAVFIGRSASERLQIFLTVQMMFSLGNVASNNFTLATVGPYTSPYLLIMALGVVSFCCAIPSIFLGRSTPHQTTAPDKVHQTWFPSNSKKKLGATLGLAFLFGCSISVSTLFLPKTIQEGSNLVVYSMLAVALAMPVTLLLLRRARRTQLTAQRVLVVSATLAVLLYTAKLAAAVYDFRTVELACTATGSIFYIFIGAALLSKISDILHLQRAADENARIAPTLLVYTIVLILGNAGGLILKQIPFMFEDSLSIAAATLAIAAWGMLLIATTWHGKTPPTQRSDVP